MPISFGWADGAGIGDEPNNGLSQDRTETVSGNTDISAAVPFAAVETSHNRGIVSRLMQRYSRYILVHTLAALAIASIAVGPSPSAAEAEMTARVKRDRAVRHADSAPVDSQDAPESDSGGKPIRASDDIASFVAPASAKPADMQGGTPTIASHASNWNDAPADGRSIVVGSQNHPSKRQIERLPYQPNAPPIG